jgi:flagellar basal-body rod protein FlgF
MSETTLIHLSRLVALQRKLDVVANNVANSNNAGFRARQLSFREYLKPEREVDETGKKERPVSLVDPSFHFTNSTPGALQPTGNPLDLAIQGEGYFVVKTAQGDRYTRAGSLTIDGSGQIVTLTGEPIMGKDGPIRVPPNDGEVSVVADGTISSKRAVLGQLRLVRFANSELLQPTRDGLLRTSHAPIDLSSDQTRIISGTLEKSNVETTREMTRLAEITRSYEMVGRPLKSSQDVEEINKLANVPE